MFVDGQCLTCGVFSIFHVSVDIITIYQCPFVGSYSEPGYQFLQWCFPSCTFFLKKLAIICCADLYISQEKK